LVWRYLRDIHCEPHERTISTHPLAGAFAAPRPELRAEIERAVGLRRPAARPTWSALAIVVSAGATWSVLAPGSGLGAPPIARNADGCHVISWSDGEVSDVGQGEPESFVRLFRAALTDR
jgi:hypothetical protein